MQNKPQYGIKARVSAYVKKLSFRTGAVILACCIPFYIFSFAQMLLPISATAKGVLWATFFGMAKGLQYLGILILGAEGIRRIKGSLRRKRRDA